MSSKDKVRLGEYLTQKDREVYGKELRVAHFQLGTDKVPLVSSYHSQYPQLSSSTEQSGRTVDTKILSKANFILGMDPSSSETSYKKEFAAKKADRVTLNQEIIKDLRATHYTLGTDVRNFQSVQKKDYVPPEIEKKSQANIDAMKVKMRGHGFKFGDDPVAYQTSTASTYKKPIPKSDTPNLL